MSIIRADSEDFTDVFRKHAGWDPGFLDDEEADADGMKNVLCDCDRTIRVRAGVAGMRARFPQEVFACSCGMRYIAQDVGCFVSALAGSNPEVLTPIEYELWKEQVVSNAAELDIPAHAAIEEHEAEVIEE